MNKQFNLLKMGIFIPLLLFTLYIPWSAQLDLWMSQQFYESGQFSSSPYLDWIYHYGIIPAWIMAGMASLGLLLSFFSSYFRQKQRVFLFLVLTLLIGSGGIVHGIFKEKWGRPRPKQSIEFGGNQPFRPFYKPNFNQPEPSKSFSCGHCTMGFYFFALMMVGIHYKNKKITWLGLSLALILGGLLSYARIAQGGHYFSDVVFSALVMWLISLIFYYYLLVTKQARLNNCTGYSIVKSDRCAN